MLLRAAVWVSVGFALALGVACGTSDDCADCTGCGIAGPVTVETLAVAEIGGGINAEPTTRLGVRAAGTCRGAAVAPKFEVRLVTPPTVTAIGDPSALAPLSGTAESGGTRLADGSLLKVETVSPTVLRFVYTGVASGPSDGGTTTKTFTCTLAGTNVTCT